MDENNEHHDVSGFLKKRTWIERLRVVSDLIFYFLDLWNLCKWISEIASSLGVDWNNLTF